VTVYLGATGIPKPKQARHFVERFAGSIVNRLAQHSVISSTVNCYEQSMAARNQQHNDRKF
jgi:hypothetical protein